MAWASVDCSIVALKAYYVSLLIALLMLRFFSALLNASGGPPSWSTWLVCSFVSRLNLWIELGLSRGGLEGSIVLRKCFTGLCKGNSISVQCTSQKVGKLLES